MPAVASAPKSLTVSVGGKKVSLDKYIASGGQASIWKNGKLAYKVYHDPSQMIPVQKIRELASVRMPNVLAPIDVVMDKAGIVPLGFTMPLVTDTEAMCMLITTGYRQKVGFTDVDAATLVGEIQKTLLKIHKLGFLVVDLNELNFLVDTATYSVPYFIDVDSWETPSFEANALMETVRDRQVKGHNFTEVSDFFSFAVIAFELYVGVHPYKGAHPDYGIKDWPKRMDDNVSVYDPKAKMPASCRPLDAIPLAHRRWLEAVIKNGERSTPPLPGAIGAIPALVPIRRTAVSGFEIRVVWTFPEDIKNVFMANGSPHVFAVCGRGVYRSDAPARSVFRSSTGEIMVADADGDVSYAVFERKPSGGILSFHDGKTGDEFFSMPAKAAMCKDGRVYAALDQQIMQCRLMTKADGSKLVVTEHVQDYVGGGSRFYDGVLYQNLFGRNAFSIPFRQGAVSNEIVAEMDGMRVVDAKCEGNALIALCEAQGIYHRFTVVYGKDFSGHTVFKEEDVQFENVNFTKIVSGPCVAVNGDTLDLFIDNSGKKTIKSPPVTSADRLFNIQGRVHFARGREISSITMTS